MISPSKPSLVLAPMDGITDAPMRELLGEMGAFTHAVSEFLRVSIEALPQKVFKREVPELLNYGKTKSGLPVQVQILGGDPGRMALTAVAACKAGAKAIDINFGCPAPTVNKHDGGASLLKHPQRIREIVSEVRNAVPLEIPVSAKLRLGWDDINDIHLNAEMAEAGGASWITIHARTRTQGYQPPVYWKPIGLVNARLSIPVIANGDIWTSNDFNNCREQTQCLHFMIGRSSLANPNLPGEIATSLGIKNTSPLNLGWLPLFKKFIAISNEMGTTNQQFQLSRLKQWIKLAYSHGSFPYFHELKRSDQLTIFFEDLESLESNKPASIFDENFSISPA